MERKDMMEIEYMLDRLFDYCPVVLQEIVATSRIQLSAGWGLNWTVSMMLRNVSSNVRSEIAEKGDLVHAIVSRVDFQALEKE